MELTGFLRLGPGLVPSFDSLTFHWLKPNTGSAQIQGRGCSRCRGRGELLPVQLAGAMVRGLL